MKTNIPLEEGETYETNPNIRCCHCKGRLVTKKYHGIIIGTNLKKHSNGGYECKNICECQNNQFAERQRIDIEANDQQYKFKYNGKVILDVQKKW